MKRLFLFFIFCLSILFQTGPARAQLPVTGVPVPELAIFDLYMEDFMVDNGLQGGILAISKDGCTAYQRGFGYAYNMSDPLPENSPMRLASVEKPLTAAVIRYLIADGLISLDDFVFDVGQWSAMGERRLLDAFYPSSTYYPYNGVFGDSRLADLRVRHLLSHMGGWDRGKVGDPMGWVFLIGDETGVEPPGRLWTVKYMMSQPLQFGPGNRQTTRCDYNGNTCLQTPAPCYCDSYSNYGYMLLSLIIKQETGLESAEIIRRRVLTPDVWVPSTEIIFGRSFRASQSAREPGYIFEGDPCTNVFNEAVQVPCPYGGWDHESKTGEGNLVASAAPLLTFLDHYHASGGNVGLPISSPVNGAKNGGLLGTSTFVRQRSDGFNVVVLLNESGPTDLAGEAVTDTFSLIDWATGIDWSTLSCVDGFWLDFNASSSGFGGHDDPFHTMNETLSATTDGTKLRIKPGTSNWAGTISQKMIIDAPFGTVTIGQ